MANKADLKTYYAHQESALLSAGRAAGVLESSTSKGRAREQLITDFLQAHLPARVTIERGEIIDSNKKSSGEVEIIVVDHESNALRLGGESVVPVEATTAMVEVKSKLNGSNLEEAIRKVARAKSLTRTKHHGLYRSTSDRTPKVPIPPPRTNGYILAYEGPSWKNVGTRLAEHPEWYERDFMTYGPEIICILTKGFVYKNDLHIYFPSPGLEELDVIEVYNMLGLKEIIYHVQETLHRYGALTYELGSYH